MRTPRIALLTGAAAVVFAGFAGMAEARTPETHVLSLRLPGGQIEQVRYTGDVPPTVVLAPEAMTTTFGPFSPFGMLEQMTAAMDQQAEALLQNIDALRMPDAGVPSDGGYEMVPALSGPGVCTSSIQITYTGNDQAPHVVSRTSGDCGPASGAANRAVAPAVLPSAPLPNQTPNVIQAKAANPYQGMVRPVSDWQR